MNTIILSSFHKELGKCNSKELYGIIEEIRPEVIFEELPQDIFDVVYSYGRNPQSLEALTIKNYLEKYKIEHFPVDTYEINVEARFQKFDLIFTRSIEYRELFQHQLSMIGRHGYSFLNSDDCSALVDKLRALEKNVLLEINDSKLISQYEKSANMDSLRENEMIENIYNYGSENKYEKAVFICGAQHRRPVIQKIMERKKQNELGINWKLYNKNAS